ncbi:beta-1,4-galactosyltransferase 2-like isoform X2 [Leucoraja erinacea]|uniref:beta-1,4-galactosyltransferase 2-like isoform X2 n=1 Tax=Leucoraja erinaceus TaxID=7782 RepID=UPI0024552D78|nr:beta-1,4-galactosyltransferase 2-like isoform X2 [Leucoraja erinacea]
MKRKVFAALALSHSLLSCLLLYNSNAGPRLRHWRQTGGTPRPPDSLPTASNATVVIETSKADQLAKCPVDPPELVGPLRITFDQEQSLEEIGELNPYVTLGGRYKPKDCEPLQRIAIIIPFRNRDHHLRHWLYYLLPILRRQQGEYGIFIIEQAGDNTFNRAKLLNVGFAEALKENGYDCFIFSDVDIIPENDKNLYRCGSNPRHLACAMDKFKYRLPYKGYFGGVVAFSKDQYLKINGFSNNYWGWGTEDDDTYMRVTLNGMIVDRPDNKIGRTKMIRHERDKGNEVNEKNYVVYNRMKFTRHRDGYKSLQYSVIKLEKRPLFTKITVDIGKPPS